MAYGSLAVRHAKADLPRPACPFDGERLALARRQSGSLNLFRTCFGPEHFRATSPRVEELKAPGGKIRQKPAAVCAWAGR